MDEHEMTNGDASTGESSGFTWVAEDEETPAAPKRKLWVRIVRELTVIGAIVLMLFSARWSLADHYTIPTGSMVPTVQIDDRVFVSKAAYDLRIPFTDVSLLEFEGPEAGDVVVLDSPEDGVLLLKRVVAVPGDEVAVAKGRLIINDDAVPIEVTHDGLVEHLGPSPHPIQLTGNGGPDFGPVTIPDRQYLVMGDNRGNSRDGRIFGLVEREAIRGEAVGVYYRDGLSWHDL